MKRKLCAILSALMLFGSVNVFAEDRVWEKEYDYVDSSENNTSNIGIKQNGALREYYILDANGNYVSGSYLNEIELTDDPDRFLLVDSDNDIMRIIDKNGATVTGDYHNIRKIEGQRRYIISLRNSYLNDMTIIDENGTELLSERYTTISDYDGYIHLCKYIGNDEYKIGYADRNSLEIIIPVEFDSYVITENRFYVYKKNSDTADYDYYKLENNVLSYYKSMPYMAEVYDYSDNEQIMLRRETDIPYIYEYGTADDDLNVLIEPAYNTKIYFGEYPKYTSSDYAVVIAGSTERFEGKGYVTYNGKYGVIDKSGKRVIPCEYDKITTYGTNTFYCEKDGIGEYIFLGKQSDIPCSDWAKDYIRAAIAREILPDDLMKNYTDKITRGEFCRLAIQTFRKTNGFYLRYDDINDYITHNDIDIDENAFSDTNDINILLAYKLGIVSGRGNKIFAPDDTITRQEAAVMLVNMAKTMNMQPEKGNEKFVDSEYFADWAKDSIYTVSNIKDKSGTAVMAGTGDGKFSPWFNYSREQAIATMVRIAEAREVYFNN